MEKEIEYAKTPDVTITVSCNNSYGTILSSSSITKKLGTKNLELSFTEAEAYQFVKWQVYDKDGNAQNCTKDDAIYIKDPFSLSTTFAILENISGYYISPECSLRPAVSLYSPQFQISGVNRDRSIIITFNTDIDKSNFRYSDEEADLLVKKGYTLLKDSDELAYGYVKNSVVYYKNLKIRNSNDSTENLLGFFDIPEVSGNKLTISPKKGAKQQFSLDSNGLKDIEVTLDNSVNQDGIKMLSDFSWSYRISNVTDEQTTVSFTTETENGELNNTGNASYNVGSEINVKFTENSASKFIDWDISKSEDGISYVAVTNNKYDETTGICEAVFTVLEGNGNVSIKPICAIRPLVNEFEPAYIASGTNFDSSIILTFKTAVSKVSFVYSQEEFESFGNTATAVRRISGDETSDIVAVDVAGERYFKNISITNSDNENIAIHYRKAELLNDNKTLTIYFDGSHLFDFSSTVTKDIFVSVNPSVFATYTKDDDTTENVTLSKTNVGQDFNFKIKNTSEAKAGVNFNVYDGNTSMGTMNYSGSKTFDIGVTFTLNFEPNEAYGFIKWVIQGNEDGHLIISEKGTELICTVVQECSGITISPYCEKLNSSTIFFESTSGSVSPSGYVDYRRNARIPLVSTISSDYCFTKWKVKNILTGEIYSDEKASQYFRFENANEAITTVTVLQDSANLSIIATAEQKPRVYTQTPNGLSNSVDRDSNIRVFMNKGLSEKSLYYTDNEAEDLESKGYIVLYEDKSEKLNPYGYYSEESDLSSYVFKNIKITDNSDGTNYLKYYDCPYLGDSTGKVLIIPVKKVMKAAGNAVDDTEGKNLPGNREILVEIGTEFGFYSDDVLVNLENVNLVWAYKTNNNFDLSKPTISSVSIKGINTSGSCTYTSDEALIPTLSTDNNWYKNRLVKKTSDGTVPATLNVTANDSQSNLQSVTLVAQKVCDSSYNAITNGNISKYTLPIVISGQNGTFNGTINLIDPNTLNLDEGLYKFYFELIDQVGNKTVTDTTMYYYLLIDYTAPKDPKNLKFFYRNGKVQVQNLGNKFNSNGDVDYASHSVTVDGQSKSCSNDETFTGLQNNVNVPLVITVSDIFGNSTDYTYQLNAGLKEGMALYTNGLFSDQVYEDLSPDSVIVDINNLDGKILIAKIRTDRTTNYDYRNNYSNEKFEGYSFKLANQQEMRTIRNNIYLLQKFGAEDSTSYGADGSVSGKTKALKAIDTVKYDGIFYFILDGGNNYYRGLYDMKTGSAYPPDGERWYSVIQGTTYNMKAVLNFYDN